MGGICSRATMVKNSSKSVRGLNSKSLIFLLFTHKAAVIHIHYNYDRVLMKWKNRILYAWILFTNVVQTIGLISDGVLAVFLPCDKSGTLIPLSTSANRWLVLSKKTSPNFSSTTAKTSIGRCGCDSISHTHGVGEKTVRSRKRRNNVWPRRSTSTVVQRQ